MGTHLDSRPASARPEVPALATRGLLLVAGVLVALELAVAARFGYHRDELYFLVAAEHPAWGYVDQPPLTPLLAGLAKLLFGGSLLGLRLLPALAGGAVVVGTGAITRELGGGRAAQLVAAACMAASGLVGVVHQHSTTTYDVLAWTLLLWLLVRLLRTRDPRLWLPIGAVAGAGLLNKVSVLQFAAAGVVALLLDPGGRRLLRGRWLAGGTLVALALWAPYLVWQARHGWPQLEVFADLRAEDGGQPAGLAFLPLQAVIANPVLTPLWVAGLVWLLRSPQGRAWRPVAVAYLLFVAFYVVVGGKFYYALGFYPALYAAGAVWLRGWFARRGRAGLPLRRLLTVAAAAAVPVVVLTLPVLPMPLLEDGAETYGWPTYVAQVEAVRAELPPAERDAAVIVTANYGEAGALERFGDAQTRESTYSGHNSTWWWGPPHGDGSVVIVVGGDGDDREFLEERFRSVTDAARLENGAGVDNEEQGQPVFVARGLRGTWEDTWSGWRHYDG
jgi:hypothetical protein